MGVGAPRIEVEVESGSARALGLELASVALDAVNARRVTERALRGLLQRGVPLDGCTVFAFGKASRGMAEAALAVSTPRCGVVIGNDVGTLGPLALLRGEHPVPSADCGRVGEEVSAMASALGARDLALVLVSGGGSSMLEWPSAQLDASALQAAIRVLLRAGLDVSELNALRTCLSRLKGGRLAEKMSPARIVNVVISDVPGHPLDVVASGPTMACKPAVDPVSIVARRGLAAALGPHVCRAIARGATWPRLEAAVIETVLAADNRTARQAVLRSAHARGLTAIDLPGFVTGPARDGGPRALALARRAAADVVVWGGETTVAVMGAGRGGRNMEVALSAATRIGGDLLLTLGTDGVDGTSGAAGALIDEAAVDAARRAGFGPWECLVRNDSGAYFEAAKTTVWTGPTGTNVADICLALRGRSRSAARTFAAEAAGATQVR